MPAGPESTFRTAEGPLPASRLPSEVWVLVAVSFVIAVGFGIVAPALPTFARSFNVSVTAASAVVSAFAFMRLVFAPGSGKLISKFGERAVYIWGISLVGLSTGACAVAVAYWQLLVLRALGGIGSTMFTVSAVALLIRLTPPAMRGRATGLWATSFLLGNVTGPVLGGGLIGLSLRAPFVVYAVSLFIAAAVAWLFLRRSTVAGTMPDVPGSTLTVREALRHSTYRAALVSNFTVGWAVFGVRVSLVPLFVVEVLHRSESLAGLALSVFAVGNVAVLMPAGKLADSFGRRPLMLLGLVIGGGATIWLGFADGVVHFLVASLISGLGTGLVTPPQGAAVADVVSSQAKGGPVLAAFQMVADIGAILGPVLTGLLADQFSYAAAFILTGGISLLAALAWLPAAETLPKLAKDEKLSKDENCTTAQLAAASGRLDEGPDVPTGQRLPGRSPQVEHPPQAESG